jgi:ammonia channel protein AmtB
MTQAGQRAAALPAACHQPTGGSRMNDEVRAALELSNAVNREFFYWVSIALMLLIHAGFMFYEAGASRVKNVLAAAMKNVMTLPIVIASFFFFGWFIYNAFPSGGPVLDDLSRAALPWSEGMGPNLADQLSGVFWGAFALFSATTASIVSGACIERIRLSAFLILATIVGSVVWVIAAAWGWHPAGWMLTELGFHDVGAAGCVHVIAGFFALGVILNLGPRIGRYVDGVVQTIRGHNLPMSMLGLMLIFVGFFGFLAGCVIYSATDGWTNIYGAPVTLSAFAFNALMGLAGGMIGAFMTSRGEPFWTVSGGLAGVISVAAGMDVYHPALGFVIAAAGGALIPLAGAWLERRGVDDPVGAVTVHGICGVWSLVAVGLFAAGYPNVDGPDTSLLGQLAGAAVFVALGFSTGWASSWALKRAGLLRSPASVEVMGLDLAEIPATPFPEGVPPTRVPPVNGHAPDVPAVAATSE